MPKPADNGESECENEKIRYDGYREPVHHFLKIAHLEIANLRIHHDARLFARVCDEADDPVSVHQLRAFQQDLLVGQVKGLLGNLHLSVKCIQVAVRALYVAFSRAQELIRSESLATGRDDPV